MKKKIEPLKVELLIDKETGEAYASIEAVKRILKSASRRYLQEAEITILTHVQRKLDESDRGFNVRETHQIDKVQKMILNAHLDYLIQVLGQAVVDTQTNHAEE